MTNTKTTKRALLASVLSVLMCISMLIGSTFAWFTDTASTNVNKIQSGTLDVDLVDADGNTLVGKTLDFKKATGAAEGEAILWEPGCTYELPEVYVINKGNLNLKYNLVITGINGDAKLNEAIVWTIKLGNGELTENAVLAPNAESDALTISGHMKEDAGNGYQGLSIDGIAITVYATQATVEYDSNGNQYDADAPTLVMIGNTKYDTLDAAVTAAESGATIKLAGKFALPAIANKAVTFEVIEDNYAIIEVGNVSCNGATINFKGITVVGNANASDFYTEQLAHAKKATYKDCTIKGLITAYCDSDFENCVFENGSDDQYSVFCYGGSAFNFTNCTFNTKCSKAIKLYSEGSDAKTLNVKGCKFISDTTDKAAVEIDSTYATNGYTVKIENCTVNAKYSKLWNDKATNSTVTVDGKNAVVVSGGQDGLNNALTGNDDVYVELPAGDYDLPSLGNQDATIFGDKNTVVNVNSGVTANGGTITFEGITVNGTDDESTFYTTQLNGAKKVIYKNCTITGLISTYCDSEFVDCTFVNTFADQYSVFCYAGSKFDFTNCTFNTKCSKAIKLYNEGASAKTLNVKDCTFTTSTEDKAAVEIDSTYATEKYTVNISDCKINGSYTKLWNDKSTNSVVTVK